MTVGSPDAPEGRPTLPAHKTPPPTGAALARLGLLSLGVVFGDIGTSPLYALRECFHGTYAVPVTEDNILGVLSLIFWSLVVVISVKYLVFVLKADNRGEGGILALTALLARADAGLSKRARWALVSVGLFGAALLYGDGMITPAISVVSAVEGLGVATPVFEPYIIPITLAVLFGLFAIQRHGTGAIGGLFGPFTLVWFAVLALLGVVSITHAPRVLLAADPRHAASFLLAGGAGGYAVLGLVFLAVTGGEALYADMGHFGARPIRIAWYTVVLPSLLLNYFGQGAYLLAHPHVARNTFYAMAPGWALYPLVILATMATVIASQAVISGVFSLTMQAVQLGYLPRVHIIHTSAKLFGQIYIAPVNWALCAATAGLVVGFRTSSNMAAAYGVAITLTMVITTVLLMVLMRRAWGWPLAAVLGLGLCFLAVDLAFFGANIVKIPEGGWFPLVAGVAVYIVLTTWKRGRRLLGERVLDRLSPLDRFIDDLRQHPPNRVEGTAVFMTGSVDRTPLALAHNLKHNKTLHERVVLLTLVMEDYPYVPPGERATVEPLGEGVTRVVAKYGFMQEPDVPRLLARDLPEGSRVDASEATFFLGQELLIASRRPGMARWRKHLFAMMSRLSSPAMTFFHIPADRVIQVGAQTEI